MNFKYILLFTLSVFILYILVRFRQSALQKAFILCLVFIMFLMSLNPDWSTHIANFFGIGRGADFLFYISHLTLFFIVFAYYLKFKEMEARLARLVRHVAINNAQENRGEQQDNRGAQASEQNSGGAAQ